jgi:hypothetical protein
MSCTRNASPPRTSPGRSLLFLGVAEETDRRDHVVVAEQLARIRFLHLERRTFARAEPYLEEAAGNRNHMDKRATQYVRVPTSWRVGKRGREPRCEKPGLNPFVRSVPAPNTE